MQVQQSQQQQAAASSNAAVRQPPSLPQEQRQPRSSGVQAGSSRQQTATTSAQAVLVWCRLPAKQLWAPAARAVQRSPGCRLQQLLLLLAERLQLLAAAGGACWPGDWARPAALALQQRLLRPARAPCPRLAAHPASPTAHPSVQLRRHLVRACWQQRLAV
jgi:hypothetical protein